MTPLRHRLARLLAPEIFRSRTQALLDLEAARREANHWHELCDEARWAPSPLGRRP